MAPENQSLELVHLARPTARLPFAAQPPVKAVVACSWPFTYSFMVPAALSRTPTRWYQVPVVATVVDRARVPVPPVASVAFMVNENLFPNDCPYCSQKPLMLAPSWLMAVRQPVSTFNRTQAAAEKLPVVSTTAPVDDAPVLVPLHCS